MGTKLSTSSKEGTPVVNVKSVTGQYFVGTLESHKQIDSQYKNEDGTAKKFDIYQFLVEDTDMAIQRKQGKEYVDADVSVGTEVSIFASTRLNNALRQAKNGDRLKITYLGLGKATKFGGKPHQYDVEVL
jgi:hypothetical protein